MHLSTLKQEKTEWHALTKSTMFLAHSVRYACKSTNFLYSNKEQLKVCFLKIFLFFTIVTFTNTNIRH